MDSAALTRCLTYIQANLDADVSLRAVAREAGCSPAYFARRFAAAMDETPKQYTTRLRLERAALRLVLLGDDVLDVALDCGFANHETFSRAFRRRFGMSPRAYRASGGATARGRAATTADLPQRAEDAAAAHSLSSTAVRTLQPMSLAFIRHTGPYERVPIGLWDALLDWARRRPALAGGGPFVLLGVAHDAPGLTAPERLRFDAAIRVPGEFRAGPRVGYQRFPGGLFALTTSVGPLAALPAAYAEIFRRLQLDRSLEVIGLPAIEFYRVNRVSTDTAIVHTEIAVPVRRRR